MDFKTKLKLRVQDVTGRVYKYLPKEEGDQKTLIEAMNYSVKAGGKRLRPLLMFEVYTMLGGRNIAIEPFMAAIEFIHTYSLIHDDLPAMDNDELRRGKPTNHVVYGEAMAILAGDGLLNYAYETCMRSFDKDINNPTAVKALIYLTQKAGLYGMVGGQSVDVESEKKGIMLSKEELDFVYRLKTGALIEAAMVIGAILADADDETVKKIETVAHNIGLAFQIQDDILDVSGNEATIGKRVGSDVKNHKETYVTLFSLEKAKSEADRLMAQALVILNSIDGKSDFLCDLIRSLAVREK